MKSLEAYEQIKDIPYQLNTWNCLHLAKYLSDSVFGTGRFPDVIERFSGLNESEASDAILKWVPEYCTVATELTNGYLVILQVKNCNNLGSFYDGKIFYMGSNGATYNEPKRLVNYIDSAWDLV